jgi:twitching motility protein PilI
MYLVPNKDKSQQGGNDAFGIEESILEADDILFQEPEVDGPKIRYGYRTGGMRFMVPEGMVSELLHSGKIYHLPNANRWLVGLTNMHGNVMPVVDIASYAGVNISHLNKSNVLAIGEGESSIGVLIDGLPEAIKENEIINDLSAVPEKLNAYIESVVYAEGYYWYELRIFDLFKGLASKNIK